MGITYQQNGISDNTATQQSKSLTKRLEINNDATERIK